MSSADRIDPEDGGKDWTPEKIEKWKKLREDLGKELDKRLGELKKAQDAYDEAKVLYDEVGRRIENAERAQLVERVEELERRVDYLQRFIRGSAL